MKEKVRQYTLQVAGESILQSVRPDDASAKDSKTGKAKKHGRSNPVAKAAARYNRERVHATDWGRDGIYTTQNGTQLTIQKGQVTNVIGELAENDQFTLQQSLAPGSPARPEENIARVSRAMWYGAFGKAKPSAVKRDEGMIHVDIRGNGWRVHWIDKDALPNTFTLTQENAKRMAGAFPERFRKHR